MASSRIPGRISKTGKFNLDIEFDGVVQSSVRAKLLVELIKQILYQRQQLPVAFEQIQRDMKMQAKDASEGPLARKTRRMPTNLELRKCETAMKALEEIFETLEYVFSMGGPVKDIILSLGATIVSPRELYIISFPTGVYDGAVMNIKTCKTFLFRRFVTCDFFQSIEPPKSCLKLTVLVHVAKHCHLAAEKLIPKMTYKIPQRGKQLHVNISCNAYEVSAELSHVDEMDANLSGIEPLEVTPSVERLNSRMRKISRCSLPPIGELNSISMETDASFTPARTNQVNMQQKDDYQYTQSEDVTDVEFVWFQVPVTMTGFRYKKSSSKAIGNLWMK